MSAYRNILVIVILLSVCGGELYAAESEEEGDIGASIYMGTYLGGGDVGHAYGYPYGTYNWTYSYGAGIHYRSIDFIHSTRLNFSLETQWMKLTTDPVDDHWGEETAECNGYALPVLLWSELMPNGKFGPFVRIGIGAMQLDLSDEYTNPDLPSRSTSYWSFAFGMGAGIYYSLSGKMDLLLIGQGMGGTQDNYFRSESGLEYKIEPFAVYFWGFNLRYWF